MRIVVESLKRLYQKGSLTKEQIRERVEKGTITKDEYKYITGEDY
ncbi:MAG: XkdX family protein [Bacteroidales bacterium]|nr:XkdX family protein [Candidatus Scybalousia scybalohippi]